MSLKVLRTRIGKNFETAVSELGLFVRSAVKIVKKTINFRWPPCRLSADRSWKFMKVQTCQHATSSRRGPLVSMSSERAWLYASWISANIIRTKFVPYFLTLNQTSVAWKQTIAIVFSLQLVQLLRLQAKGLRKRKSTHVPRSICGKL